MTSPIMSTYPPPTTKPFHIAVVGGGIGGLATAIGLLRQGISCTIYEAAPAFAEIGAGVSFGPNAIRAMSLISPEIEAGFSRIVTKNGWPDSVKTWFDIRLGEKQPTAYWPDGTKGQYLQQIATVTNGAGQSSVHRAHFLDELVRLVPSKNAAFGKRLANLTTVTTPENGKKKVVLEFQDGTTAEADAVIGCDGIKSQTRKILLGPEHRGLEPTFSGKYAYRGLIPMPAATAALGQRLSENSQMYLGRKAHILTFPVGNGSTGSAVAVPSIPAVNVVAFKSAPAWPHKDWVLPVDKKEMYRDFEGWGEVPQNILKLLEKQRPEMWAIFDHPDAPSFVGLGDRLCLMGDAAHATTPHQGAGAGQAIEDAYVLTGLLGECGSVEDMERAFKTYDEVRRPRGQRVVRTSRRAGSFYAFEDGELGEDLERLKETLSQWYRWIWEEDLEEELGRARRFMRGVEGKTSL